MSHAIQATGDGASRELVVVGALRHLEDVLHRPQPRVVVVVRVGDGSGLDERGDEHRTGDTTAGGGVLGVEGGQRGLALVEVTGDAGGRHGDLAHLTGRLERLVVLVDEDEGAFGDGVGGLLDLLRTLVLHGSDVGPLGDTRTGDLATQILDRDRGVNRAHAGLGFGLDGLGPAVAGTGVLGTLDTVGGVGVDEVLVLLTGRRTSDVTVVTGAGELLVAVLVGLHRGVGAGRLPVDVHTVDVLSGGVGSHEVLRHLGRVGEGVGGVLLVALGEFGHRRAGVLVEHVARGVLGDLGVVGGVVEAHVRERWVRLVEGDVDETAVLEGVGLLDEWDVVLQPQIGGVEATDVVLRRGAQRLGVVRLAVLVEQTGEVVALTGGVVGVGAVVRGDPVERWHLVGRLGQIGQQPLVRVLDGLDVVLVGHGSAVHRTGESVLAAVVVADDRVEPREGEVLGDVLVVLLGTGERGDALGLVVVGRLHRLRVVRGVVLAGAGSATQGVLSTSLGMQVLGVSLPGHASGVELVEEGGSLSGVGAAVLAVRGVGSGQRHDLTVVVVGAEGLALVLGDDRLVGAQIGVGDVAVGLQIEGRGLAGDQGGVVVLGVVAGAVVVGEQGTLGGQRLPQVGVLVESGEGGVVGLVLQDDQPHVLDVTGLEPGRRDALVAGGGGRSRGRCGSRLGG